MNCNKWWLFLIAIFITADISSSSSASDIAKLPSGTINNSSGYSSSWFLETTPEVLQKAHAKYEAIMTSEPAFSWMRSNEFGGSISKLQSIRTRGFLTPKDLYTQGLLDEEFFQELELQDPIRSAHTYFFPNADAAIKYSRCLGFDPRAPFPPIIIALIPRNQIVHCLPMTLSTEIEIDKGQYIKVSRNEWKEIEKKHRNSFDKRSERFNQTFDNFQLHQPIDLYPFIKKEDSKEEFDRASKEYVVFPEIRSRSYHPDEIKIGQITPNDIQRLLSTSTTRSDLEKGLAKLITPPQRVITDLRRATMKHELLKEYAALSKNIMPSSEK